MLNGCKLTGFAFGMFSSQMASSIDRRDPSDVWQKHLAEAVASGASSASCYDAHENIRVLPIVEPELKLVQVERQVGPADIVVGADHAALQERPDVIHRFAGGFVGWRGVLSAVLFLAADSAAQRLPQS